MQFLRKTSIKGKQTLIVMLTSGVALLLACMAFASYEVTTFRTAMVQNLSTLAEIIGNNSSAALDFADPKTAKETLSALRAEPNIVAGCIYTAKGEVFAVYVRSGNEAAFLPPALQADSYYFSKDALHLFRPVVHNGEYLGTVYVVSDLNALYSRLNKYALIAVGVFFASGLVAFLVSSQLQRLISGPILSLVKTARAVTVEKNYSVRAVKQSDDELGVLIDAFNEMLKQIQERDADLQKSHVELEKRVTERTEEVVNSLSLIRATLESTTDGILVTDERGQVTSFNEKFIEMWRIPRETVNLGNEQRMLEAAVPQLKDPAQFLSKVNELNTEPEKESFDLLEFKDGRVFERYSKTQRIEEKCVGRVWSFRDITERRQAEIELAYERDLLRSLLDNSPDQIYFKDAQSRFVKSSNAQANQFGLKNAEEVVGKTDFDFFDEEHARPAFEDEQEIIRTGHPLVGRVEKEVWKDGRVSWALTNKMPIRNKDGKIIGTLGISKDITAIKKMEMALIYERDLLKALLDNIPDTIYFKDLQSRFVRMSNSKTERSFEVSLARHFASHPAGGVEKLPAHLRSLERFAEYLIGKTDFDLVSEKKAREFYEEEQEVIRTGVPLISKVSQTTIQDGEERWFIVSRIPWRDKDGEIVGTFGVSKDITAMKLTEAQLQQVHKRLLDTSRQAGMAEVATSVLHNVGNVLNSVNVSFTLVSNQVRKSKVANLSKVVTLLNEHAADLGAFLMSDPKGKQLPNYLSQLAEHLVSEQNTVLKELNLLHKNIEHIKDIVVMQQGYAKISGVIETVKITDLIEDALRLNLGALQRHGVEVLREFEDMPPMDVEKHKILQILVNLVRNAKYACNESLRTDKRMTLRVSRSNNQVKISIIDNGIGIPAENLTRIFNHGFTTRKDGHGFGLHSAVLAAMELGGSLRAQSDGIDKGATFTLELPYKPHKDSHNQHES